MLLRRLVPRAHAALRREMCDAAKPLAARMVETIAKTKQLEVKLDALDKEELMDLVVGLVRSNEVTNEQVQRRLPEFRVEHAEPRPYVATGKLRFELGTAVECRLGPDAWSRGRIIGHWYREDDWPDGQKAPYQVLLEGDDLTHRTIWAPTDTDECIRSTVRFPVGAAVECCVGVDQWVRGEVVAHYYREKDWPMQLLAPYRVRIDVDTSGEGIDVNASGEVIARNEVFIWAPIDSDECIRAADAADRHVLRVEEVTGPGGTT